MSSFGRRQFLKGAVFGGLIVFLDYDRRNTEQQLIPVRDEVIQELAQQGVVPPPQKKTYELNYKKETL